MEKLGEYIYMGMVDLALPYRGEGNKQPHTTCVAVGYTKDYTFKKMKEVFELLKFTHFISNPRINKVKVGEKTHCEQELVSFN